MKELKSTQFLPIFFIKVFHFILYASYITFCEMYEKAVFGHFSRSESNSQVIPQSIDLFINSLFIDFFDGLLRFGLENNIYKIHS